MTLAKFHDDVQEVHAVEFHLLAEVDRIIQIGQILVRGNVSRISRISSLISSVVIGL